jgi:hypothetical protein
MPRREIYLGMTKLEEHLRQAGVRAPFVLTDLLRIPPYRDRPFRLNVTVCSG